MKAKILEINGKEKGTIELPKIFSHKIREDIVTKILEAKKIKQPHSPSPLAGNQYSARGKIVHRRHVWKSQYGRGISRVPRKIFSRRGTQFNWEAAGVPHAKGGMRAHPPKVISMINTNKINKKEMKIAIFSALSATADKKIILSRYKTLQDKKDKIKNFPLIVESKITTLKTKELLFNLKKILEELFDVSVKKKKIRAGKGKMRGRKYKSNAGMLLVLGEKEKLKTNAFDVQNVKNLGVNDLAKGGLGRITLYTEEAIKDLEKRFKEK